MLMITPRAEAQGALLPINFHLPEQTIDGEFIFKHVCIVQNFMSDGQKRVFHFESQKPYKMMLPELEQWWAECIGEAMKQLSEKPLMKWLRTYTVLPDQSVTRIEHLPELNIKGRFEPCFI